MNLLAPSHHLLVTILFTATLAEPVLRVRTPSAGDCADAIPESLQTQLARARPGFVILQFSMLTPDLRREWPHIGRRHCPGLVAADFNGDGLTDYGILAARPKNSSKYDSPIFEIQLLAALQTREGGWDIQRLVDYGESAGSIYLQTGRPGAYNTWDGKTIVARYPVLESTLFESATQIHVWLKGRFITFNTSE